MSIRPSASLVVALLSASFLARAEEPPAIRKDHHRSVDLSIMNEYGRGAPEVSGKEAFPVRLVIRDKGTWTKPRRTQVLISIGKQAGSSPFSVKFGERVLVKADPRIFTTPADEDGVHPFDLDIPLPPGEYVAHVFVCDPDRPFDARAMDHPSFPAPEEFPGTVVRGKAMIVHVEPVDDGPTD